MDFDGVLAPIVGVIPAAAAGRRTLELLRKLARRKNLRIAIVTGRRLSEIKRKIPVPGVAYSGNHGLEIEDGEFSFLHRKARSAARLMPRLADALEEAISPFAEAEVERKTISLSMHTRRSTPRDAESARKAALRVLRRTKARLRVHEGKRVVEIQPDAAWNKGNAFELLHRRIGGVPVFLGDDAGDEAAFLAAGRAGGFGIRVSPTGTTAARYSIPSQRMVVRFLERLLTAVR